MPRKTKAVPAPPRKRRRGSGSISIATRDGTIRARLPARLDPSRKAREFPPGHLAEAEAWLDSYLHPTPAAPPAPAVTTLGAWTGHWWQTYVEPIAAPNTARRYQYQLRQLGELLSVPVADIRPSMIQAAAAAYARRVSPASVHAAAGVWRQCLEAAVDDGLIARNPARRLTLPKMVARPPARYLTAEEAVRLLDAARGHRFEAAFALVIGCGLRIGEVLGLAWADVDLAGQRAQIRRQWTSGQWRERTKGGRARWVRLPPPVVRALIRHRNNQPEGTALVMQSPRRRRRTGAAQPWSDDAVTADLRALAAELGIPDLTPHAGRRGLVTALLDGGLSLASAAHAVGHANTTTTLRYAQATDVGADRAARIADHYLGETADGIESVS